MKVFKAPVLAIYLWIGTTLLWWSFAFWPVPTSPPPWLLVAQQACFGTLENGLPAAYGWMLLILSPLSLLIGIFVIWGSEVAMGLRQSLSYGWGKSLAVIAVSSIILDASWVGVKISVSLEQARAQDAAPSIISALPESYPRTTTPAGNFELIDQKGNTVSLARLRGESFILTFAFAHCASVCPMLVRNIKEALAEVPAKLVIITLDPWRDRPSSLEGMAKTWQLGEGSHILSAAKPETVLEVIKAYNVPTERNQKSGDVVHPALVYIVDRDGKIAYSFNNPSPRWLKEALLRLQKDYAKISSVD